VRLLLDVFSVVAIVAGAVFYLAGTVGLLRFPDAYTRLHALTKADNLALVLVVIGLLPQVNGVLAGLKLVLVWLLVMLSSAAVSQLIARSARRQETRP
jgi:multicomponent Na+:H+ antiporter subunit G